MFGAVICWDSWNKAGIGGVGMAGEVRRGRGGGWLVKVVECGGAGGT